MKQLLTFLLILLCLAPSVKAADSNNRVILVTVDGVRWRELFGATDSILFLDKTHVRDSAELHKLYDRPTLDERLDALIPFTRSVIEKQGLVIGNRWKGCKMDVTNGMQFSYPGYNEIFTGHPDDVNITSNDKVKNPNVSVFELANNTPKYHGKVLIFGSWDLFPYIFNVWRSKLEVNGGRDHALSPKPTQTEKLLDEINDNLPRHFDYLRYDALTLNYALEAMRTRHPELVCIGFGEPDDFAHEARYDEYLKAITRFDGYLKRIWEFVQNDKFYRGKTTIIVTTDHGRGYSASVERAGIFRCHSTDFEHSGETWLMAIGNQIPAKGVIEGPCQYYTNQVAATVANLLGIPFTTNAPGTGKAMKF
jgi:hypothetical protein